MNDLPLPKDARAMQSPLIGAEAFEFRGVRVIRSVDDGKLHVSVSLPHRYPTWDELHDVRYAFCPDQCDMAMILPPKKEYVNVHPNTFHLWQL